MVQPTVFEQVVGEVKGGLLKAIAQWDNDVTEEWRHDAITQEEYSALVGWLSRISVAIGLGPGEHDRVNLAKPDLEQR